MMSHALSNCGKRRFGRASDENESSTEFQNSRGIDFQMAQKLAENKDVNSMTSLSGYMRRQDSGHRQAEKILQQNN
jgi:hypothetical protein